MITSDVLITASWSKLSAETTGEFLLQNEAQAGDKFSVVGSNGSSAIRYAFSESMPSIRGMILYAGSQISRGDAIGHVWARCDSGYGNILAQYTEAAVISAYWSLDFSLPKNSFYTGIL